MVTLSAMRTSYDAADSPNDMPRTTALSANGEIIGASGDAHRRRISCAGKIIERVALAAKQSSNGSDVRGCRVAVARNESATAGRARAAWLPTHNRCIRVGRAAGAGGHCVSHNDRSRQRAQRRDSGRCNINPAPAVAAGQLIARRLVYCAYNSLLSLFSFFLLSYSYLLLL